MTPPKKNAETKIPSKRTSSKKSSAKQKETPTEASVDFAGDDRSQCRDVGMDKICSEFCHDFQEEFWPRYLEEIRNPVMRRAHLAASFLAVYFIFRFLVLLEVGSLIFAPIVLFGIVFAAHKIITDTKPLLFEQPIFSVLAEFKVFALWCAGDLKRTMEAHNQQLK